MRSLGGFSIEGELDAALPSSLRPTLLPLESPSPKLNVLGLLPSQVPNSLPSLASRVPSGIPTLAPTLAPSRAEYTSLRPSLLPTRQPTLFPSRHPSTSLSLTSGPLPTAGVEPALEPDEPSRVKPQTAIPSVHTSVTGKFSVEPSGNPHSVDSIGPSIGPGFPAHLYADTTPPPRLTAPLAEPPTQYPSVALGDIAPSELTVLPTVQPTQPAISPLTRPPTRQPSAAPTDAPFTLAPMSPGDPRAAANPTFAPTPIPCPGRPPCMDQGYCITPAGKCSCHAGWSVSATLVSARPGNQVVHDRPRQVP
jgi:hypothetical protein